MSFFKFLLSVLLIFVSTLRAQEIRIAVSDLIAGYIHDPLKTHADEYEFMLDIESIGSLPALDKLRSDEVDLAIIAMPEDIRSQSSEFTICPFAYDASLVLVNQSNPIQDISINQLGGIFGSREELSVSTWGRLGFSGLGSRNINPLVGISENSITLELFKHRALKGSSLNTNVTIDKVDNIEALIISNVSSIAIMPFTPIKSDIKALMISKDSESPAFGPTPNNIHHGDYPIRMPYCIAYNQYDEAKLISLIRKLLEDEVAYHLETNGIFPLPPNVRRKLVMELELE